MLENHPLDQITLHLHCHCTLTSYTLSVASSSLPLSSAICHCSSCRHATGQLVASFVALPPEIQLDVSQLTRYASSERYTRYFCPRCGAHVANHAAATWMVCSGLLDRIEAGWVQRKQIFIEGARDGECSVWLTGLCASGEAAGEGMESRTHFVPEKKDERAGGGGGGGAAETVSASCHCRGVRFMLTRPDDAAPGPAGNGERWWLRDSGQHYAAVFDACESCRRTTGFELVAWAHVPRVNVRMLDGSPFELRAGTLASYESSLGIHRDFCGRCGAAVFFRKDGREGEVWDVAVGLLDADSGARAEGWLGWDAKVSFEGEAVDGVLVGMLEEGLKSWQERRGRRDDSETEECFQGSCVTLQSLDDEW